jgi:tetratricopeptide (TPR) repeat protein
MKHRVLYYAGLMVLLAAFMAACTAGKKQYDTGMQLSQAGKYEDAIAYIEEALANEPNNKEYKQSLAEIKVIVVKQYVDAGSKELGYADSRTISSINRAKATLARAQKVDSASAVVRQFAAQVNAAESSLVSEVKKLYGQAREFKSDEEWVKAYFNFQQIQARFPNYEDSYQLMAQIADQGADAYYTEAKALFEKDDYKGVKPLLRNALSLKPGHTAARKMEAVANQRDNMSYFIKKGGKAISAKDWDTAVAAYNKALEYQPGNKKLKMLVKQVYAKAGQYYIQDSRQLMDIGWLLKALDSYELAVKYSTNPNNYQLSSLRRDLSARAALVASRFSENEQFGSAWYWYLKLREINRNFTDIFYLSQAMEDKIKARVRKSIAVFDFNSPSDNVDAGVIVANNLITYLFKNASGDIKILERENLKSILEEMKLGQIGVVSANSAKEMGRVYGIDVAIMGSVLLFKVDSTSAEGIKTVRYQVGTKIDDNIEYLNWVARNPKPTPEQLAAAPPAKIEKPDMAEKDYRVANYKKIGFVQLSFRIVDVATGENIQVKTIERKVVAEDESSSGLAEAGVKFDPLEIPTDTELLQKMTYQVVAELGKEALSPLQNLEQTYYKKGENYLRRRDSLSAAENFVNAIFDEKLKRIAGSPLTKAALDNLNDIFLQHKVTLEE